MDGHGIHSYDDGNVDSRISRDINMGPIDGYMRTWLNDLRYDRGDVNNDCLTSYPLTRLDCFDLPSL